jgi:hypothetical protein
MRWRSKLLVVAAVGVATAPALPVRSAVAAEADFYVNLRYEIGASMERCWDEGEFRRSVAHRVGYDPFREDASITVLVRVGGTARAVDGRVEWRSANGTSMGERRFVARDGRCSRLLTEVSFAVSLQIELLRPKAPAGVGAVPAAGAGTAASASAAIPATVAAPPASTSPPVTSAPAPLPPATPPTAAPAPVPDLATLKKTSRPSEEAAPKIEPPAADDSPPWPMWVGIGPSMAWRISPGITADARLFLGVRRNDLSVEVGAEASYPSTERQWDGTGFRQSLIGGSAAVCGHRQAISACVLGKASQVRVAGLGVDQPRSPTGFVAQAGLRLAAARDLGESWFATAHIDALGLLVPCTITLSRAGVWDMPRLGALAGIELAARFR